MLLRTNGHATRGKALRIIITFLALVALLGATLFLHWRVISRPPVVQIMVSVYDHAGEGPAKWYELDRPLWRLTPEVLWVNVVTLSDGEPIASELDALSWRNRGAALLSGTFGYNIIVYRAGFAREYQILRDEDPGK